jgi:hypothetical protein
MRWPGRHPATRAARQQYLQNAGVPIDLAQMERRLAQSIAVE